MNYEIGVFDIEQLGINGPENKTLFFIGNGFDLFHGVKSRFKDFRNWLDSKGDQYEKFVYQMEELFPLSDKHGNLLWADFESALGKIDIAEIHTKYSGALNDDIYDEEYQKRAARHFRDIVSQIPVYLNEWARDMNLTKVTPKLELSKDSLYLTFNYTLLLEQLYQIPQCQILHIHGSIDNQKPLITGHRESFSMNGIDIRNNNIEKSYQLISDEAESLRKPVDELIDANMSYFKSLGHIQNVVVFGHSLSMIDMPYFKEVLHHVGDDAKWFFTYIDDVERNKAQEIVSCHNQSLHKVIGMDRYAKKMKEENCKYINLNGE